MKKIIISLIVILSFAVTANAQHSPFRPLPKPLSKARVIYGANTSITQTAWRFTAPMGGVLYSKGNSQIVTALGFGWNKLQFNDSTQNWDTKLSINGIIIGGGNIAPNPKDQASIISIGLSLGLLNQHIQIGPAYNFPSAGQPGGLGKNLAVFIAVSMPLN